LFTEASRENLRRASRGKLLNWFSSFHFSFDLHGKFLFIQTKLPAVQGGDLIKLYFIRWWQPASKRDDHHQPKPAAH